MGRDPQHMEYMCNKDRGQLVFLTAKCASMSIRETLWGHGFVLCREHPQNEWRTVAVVRNPLGRFISAFITVEVLCAKRARDPNPDLLANFVLTVMRLREHYQDIHYLPQAQFIKDPEGCPLQIDHYLSLENLTEEWEALDLPTPLKHENECAFPDSRARVMDYLIRHWELTGIINKFYAEDWKLYESVKGGDCGN